MSLRFGNALADRFLDPSDTAPATRVALVGGGAWGAQHARAITAHPRAELVALVGRDPERTRERARTWGVPGFTAIDAMLADAEPDLVALSLPNRDHFEPTLAVLEAGVPCFAEKPLVFELEKARSLVDAAVSRGLFAAINFNHRYSEAFLRAHQALARGRLGDPVHALWRFGGDHPEPMGHPDAQLIETQCHGIDQLLHFCGPIESVTAQMGARTGKRGWSTVSLGLAFTSGALGTLVGSYDSDYRYRDAQLFELDGTGGRLRVHDTVRRLELHRRGEDCAEIWEAGYFDDEARFFAGTHDRHFAEVLRALRAGDPPPVPLDQGLRVLEVQHAAILAHETGRRVALQEIQTA